MSLQLLAHPFASYCWKPLIALYENSTPFALRLIEDATGWADLAALWPLKKFPLLRDGDATIVESSIIVEYLMLHHPGPAQLIPSAADPALHIRFMDRFFDNYVMHPMQTLVSERMRAQAERDRKQSDEAKATLDRAYAWLENRLPPQSWAGGGDFSLADCSAAPALFYAHWVHPLSEDFRNLLAYRERLLARPSVARVVEEARPYRRLFPGGAPDLD